MWHSPWSDSDPWNLETIVRRHHVTSGLVSLRSWLKGLDIWRGKRYPSSLSSLQSWARHKDRQKLQRSDAEMQTEQTFSKSLYWFALFLAVAKSTGWQRKPAATLGLLDASGRSSCWIKAQWGWCLRCVWKKNATVWQTRTVGESFHRYLYSSGWRCTVLVSCCVWSYLQAAVVLK